MTRTEALEERERVKLRMGPIRQHLGFVIVLKFGFILASEIKGVAGKASLEPCEPAGVTEMT